jgi:hypothetical protein
MTWFSFDMVVLCIDNFMFSINSASNDDGPQVSPRHNEPPLNEEDANNVKCV